MKASKWIFAFLLGTFFLAGTPAFAQDEEHGHGHGKGNEKHDRDDDRDKDDYKHHEKDIRGWYAERGGNLPPGLAKKDRLPPGLERQLVVRGTLPPGLQKRLYPCPEDLERRLPPPPPECAHVLIGGHIVLLNRRTNLVVDVFHVELF